MPTCPFMAVVHAGDGEGDPLLRQLCTHLQTTGWRVRGLLPLRGKDPQRRLPMLIGDVRDGRAFAISQALGPGSLGCCLDPGALAHAGKVLREALHEQPDLVIVNRFGSAEASGQGYSSEMLALMSEGIPLLTLVSPKYQADWQRFVGRHDCLLPLRESALLAWTEALSGVARGEHVAADAAQSR